MKTEQVLGSVLIFTIPSLVASASHGSAAVGCVLDREEALGLAAEEETPTPP